MFVPSARPLSGKVVVVTGAAGMLGREHCLAIASAGGVPVLLDKNRSGLRAAEEQLESEGYPEARCIPCDVTDENQVMEAVSLVSQEFGSVHGLVCNAALNPRIEDGLHLFVGIEEMALDQWHQEISVGLTGTLLPAMRFGAKMSEAGEGSIVIVGSDFSVIAPRQNLYSNLLEDGRGRKPVGYSVVKHGQVGLMKYLATYWADRGVRTNMLSPGAIDSGIPSQVVGDLVAEIPMKRMAETSEFQGSLVFLLSYQSSFMTGHNLIIDGGRSCW